MTILERTNIQINLKDAKKGLHNKCDKKVIKKVCVVDSSYRMRIKQTF